MSLYLRLVVGPVVICDVELFGTTSKPDPNEPPPQLNGGQGQVIDPWIDSSDVVRFGFR